MEGESLVSISRLEELLQRTRVDLRALSLSVEGHYRPFHLHDSWGQKRRDRHVDDPDPELKAVQRAIKRLLHGLWVPPYGMFGAVAKRSLLHNAKVHVGRQVLVTIDIERCFPSISNKLVYEALQRLVGCSATARLITKLVTLNFHLPQGAPTSPVLANIVLQPALEALQAHGRRIGVSVSCWIDDFAFSGARAPEMLEVAHRAFGALGLTIAKEKTRIMRSHKEALAVTGLVLNRRPSAGKLRLQTIASAIKAAGQPGVTQGELVRVRSMINFVKSISPTQGARLGRYAAKTMPKMGRPGPRPPKRFQPVACDCNDGRRLQRRVAARRLPAPDNEQPVRGVSSTF